MKKRQTLEPFGQYLTPIMSCISKLH